MFFLSNLTLWGEKFFTPVKKETWHLAWLLVTQQTPPTPTMECKHNDQTPSPLLQVRNLLPERAMSAISQLETYR